MNPFSTCIKQQPIRLSAEDEGEEHDDHHHHSTRHRNCGLGWPFTTCLFGTTGRIRLPDDAAADDILDDYLDPNTTVGIEPLLAQHAIKDNQGEDDDDDDDEDNNNKQFMKHDMFNEPHRFLSRNPFATTSSSSGILGSTDFYDEDAQFLSDRRISDVLEQNQEQDDGKEEKEDKGMDNKDEEFGQELVDVVRPPPQSTSELEDWTQMDQKEGNEMADTVTTHAAESSHQNTFVATSIQPTTRTTSLTTAAKEESTTAISNNDFPILGLPRTTQVIAPTPIPAAPLNKPATTTAAEDEALLLPPPSPPTPVPESTVTTDDLPLLETEQPQQHPLDTQVPLTESTAQKTPDVLPADPPTFTAADSQVDDGNSNNNKRTSVAATMAQSILGDRLEDFTEKLAFIKKNIIMSLEDEETMDEEDRVLKPSFSETNRRRTSFDPLVKPTRERSTPPVMQQQQRQHKRSSSLMDVASPAIARFLNQMSGDGEDNGGNRGGSFSPSSFFASLAAPESHEPSENNNNTEPKQRHDPLLARQRPPRVASPSILPLQEEDEEGQDDEEELFDFNKMFTLGKSVFNDVANRVKNANKQQQQQQQQQQADEQGNDNWIIDRQAWI